MKRQLKTYIYQRWIVLCFLSCSMTLLITRNGLPPPMKSPVKEDTGWNIRIRTTTENKFTPTTPRPTYHFDIPDTYQYILCAVLHGGMGNQMFQLASLYALAAKKGMYAIIDSNNSLTNVFKLDVNMMDNFNSICETLPTKEEILDCGYDESLDTFQPDAHYRVKDYLQSWKYFYNYTTILRKQFTFHNSITETRNSIIKSILKKYYFKSRAEVTLIGVHVRRGDIVNNSFGYRAASPSYLEKGVRYFQLKRLKNPIFVICSNDMDWTKKHMIKGIRSEYITGHSEGVDMAVLGGCDHIISSTGTFGWWSSWLTSGEVTFYQWPAQEGSPLRKQFSKDYTDFFYPGWVGFS
ncbi:galactoside alpha-(1,2)-fucosyltransferase 2-like isoform X2 [Argopecten irradians]